MTQGKTRLTHAPGSLDWSHHQSGTNFRSGRAENTNASNKLLEVTFSILTKITFVSMKSSNSFITVHPRKVYLKWIEKAFWNCYMNVSHRRTLSSWVTVSQLCLGSRQVMNTTPEMRTSDCTVVSDSFCWGKADLYEWNKDANLISSIYFTSIQMRNSYTFFFSVIFNVPYLHTHTWKLDGLVRYCIVFQIWSSASRSRNMSIDHP